MTNDWIIHLRRCSAEYQKQKKQKKEEERKRKQAESQKRRLARKTAPKPVLKEKQALSATKAKQTANTQVNKMKEFGRKEQLKIYKRQVKALQKKIATEQKKDMSDRNDRVVTILENKIKDIQGLYKTLKAKK